MATVVTIGGVTKTLQRDTIAIRSTTNGRAVLTADVVSLAGTYRPALDAAITVAVDSVTIFGGLITTTSESGQQSVKGTAIVTHLTAVDYSTYASRVIVTETIAAGTLKAALQVLDDYLTPYGVTLDAAQVTGPTLAALAYADRRLSDVLDELAAMTGYVWEIDATKTFRMYLPSSNAAPFNLSEGDGRILGDLTVEPSRNDYANRILVKAGTGVKDIEDERHVGNGTTRTFTLDAQLLAVIGTATVVDGGSTNYPVGIYGVDTSLAWTYDAATNALRQKASETVISSSGYVSFNYRGQFPMTATANDTGEQGTYGLWEKIITAPDVFTMAVAQDLADAYLAVSILAPNIVRYTVTGVSLKPGMTQTIVAASRNVASGTYTLTEVETFAVGHLQWRQRVTAVEGSTSTGTWRDEWKRIGAGGGSAGVSLVGSPVLNQPWTPSWVPIATGTDLGAATNSGRWNAVYIATGTGTGVRFGSSTTDMLRMNVDGATGNLTLTYDPTGLNRDMSLLRTGWTLPVALQATTVGVLDTGSDHYLHVASGENLSANRTLTTVVGNADRTLTLSGNPTLADWFDQAVKAASNPTFAALTTTSTTVTAGASAVQAKASGVLYQSTTAVGNVGSGEDDLITQAIAASVLGTNGQRLVGRFAGTFAANGNTKRLKLKFGATTIWDMTNAYAPNGGQWVIDFSIVRTGATAQIAYATYLGAIGHTLTAAAGRGAPAETLSGAVTLKVTGEATSDNDIVCDEFSVAWRPAP